MNVDFFQKVKPIEKSDKRALTIVLSTDDNYAPYAGVTICSLLENASKAYFYDIVILDNDISSDNVKRLKEIAIIEGLSDLRFVDVSELNDDAIGDEGQLHFTKAVYMRLYIPYFFREHQLVLYLDCDTVVLTDVSTLFEIEMGENYVAGVSDSIFPKMVHDPQKYILFQDKKIPVVEYTRKHLGFADSEIHEYINSGILLFNIKAFSNEQFFVLEDIDDYIYRGYHFVDQCIINILFRGRIKYLHQKWNVLQGKIELKYLPEELKHQLIEANKFPCILHFVSGKKPWNAMGLNNEDKFWKYCQKTSFHKNVLNTCFAEEHDKLLKNSHKQYRTRIIKLKKKNQRLQAEINCFINSYSWKITRPLRGIKLLFTNPKKFFANSV